MWCPDLYLINCSTEKLIKAVDTSYLTFEIIQNLISSHALILAFPLIGAHHFFRCRCQPLPTTTGLSVSLFAHLAQRAWPLTLNSFAENRISSRGKLHFLAPSPKKPHESVRPHMFNMCNHRLKKPGKFQYVLYIIFGTWPIWPRIELDFFPLKFSFLSHWKSCQKENYWRHITQFPTPKKKRRQEKAWEYILDQIPGIEKSRKIWQ